MSRRRVKPDELELWGQVAKTTDPLHRRPKSDPGEDYSPPLLKDKKSSEVAPSPAPLPAFRLGQKALPRTETRVVPEAAGKRLARDPVKMDSKAFQRLKRGKLVPEARIDLHGLTLDRAHPELVRFILTSQARGLRLVLVITGKGAREDPYDPLPRPRGVLKRQVPMWLKMAPLTGAVLQVSESHIRHGGEGAYYVYLRRHR